MNWKKIFKNRYFTTTVSIIVYVWLVTLFFGFLSKSCSQQPSKTQTKQVQPEKSRYSDFSKKTEAIREEMQDQEKEEHSPWRKTVKKGFVGCRTEQEFDSITGIIRRKDQAGFISMLATGRCYQFKDNYKFSILDTGFSTCKIRVYDGNNSLRFVDLITNIEAITKN